MGKIPVRQSVNPPLLDGVLRFLWVLGDVPTTGHGGLERLYLILDEFQLPSDTDSESLT